MTTMEQYDLLFVVDATFSMEDFIVSLNTSLPRIISVSALTGCFQRVGLLAYRDYCDDKLLEWSGWLDNTATEGMKQPDPVGLAKTLEPIGGGDFPEAVKTALANACEVIRSEATTIMLLYTDAAPHTNTNKSLGENAEKETRFLSYPPSFGGMGPLFKDWVSACNQFHEGAKKAQVFCILDSRMGTHNASHFNFLASKTRGACINLRSSKPSSISQVTMEVLLAWMGLDRPDAAQQGDKPLPAELSRYISIKGMNRVSNEDYADENNFFPNPGGGMSDRGGKIRANITTTPITLNTLMKHLPKKSTPVPDFAESWKNDPEYRTLAVRHLKKIMEEDITAITLNPVFGKLWRTICGDRTNDDRDNLIEAFGLQVQKVTNAEDRAFLTKWLEASYDYTTEILSTIESVPEEERFPCVFLDPTISFTSAKPGDNDDDENETNKPITSMTRAELLEIGRSCDPKILRRLSRVLTRLTYASHPDDMPEHIAAARDEDVPKIPMALASKTYDSRFWKILLHIILPGTMLASRGAALLAALSLKLGITPLIQAADREMLGFRNKWNNLEVPENWNVSCLSLLLDADTTYRERQKQVKAAPDGNNAATKPFTLLKPADRKLFEHLVSYRMLELNLDSSLTARVGWAPAKDKAPIGPLVVCRLCRYPRSVTIMGPNGKCGVCLSTEEKELKRTVGVRVSKDDGEDSTATWVECCVQDCRAQYVVYMVEDLNVRPKCHYCREQSLQKDKGKKHVSAPWVECRKCLNRVIFPQTYRPSSFVKSDFICPPCTSGVQTITDTETTAKKLSKENSLSWLVCDSENPDASPFTGRSLFNTITTIGNDAFVNRIQIFPPVQNPPTLKGKTIHSFSSLIDTLKANVFARHTERVSCSLCFSTFRPADLNPACGRRGCFQRICTGCLSGWYALNTSGRIINTAALSCPFCRRFPAGRTLAKYGMGIHAVRNLKDAIQDRGTWIYAWCSACTTAKQYLERVCANGAPAEFNDWTCEECREEAERLRAEEEMENQIMMHQIRGEEAEEIRRRLREQTEAERISKIRPCPGCGTMTEKTAGCGHIICTVRKCGVHWCYFCGEQFSESLIYSHMKKNHGGAFGDEYDDDDDEYDY